MSVVGELSTTTTALRIGNASRWQHHPLTNSIKVASRISEHYDD